MKKETLQNIVYSPLYLWFKLHAILPMRILYILSDILYFPLYYIVHYRRKLVSENLRKAFPDKTDKELKQLEQKFYHQIYRPLKNKWFDRFFLKLRSRFGSVCIAKQDTLRAILQMKRSGKPSITGFMSDQTPSPTNIHHWARFLSQDSPVLTGFEKIARKTDFAVLYFDVEIVNRRHYTQLEWSGFTA